MQESNEQYGKWGKFNMKSLGTQDRWVDPDKKEGPDTHGITVGRQDAFNSMINLLLNHQQEIVKVPACSTLESANEWCRARPKSGYRAGLAHLNDDRIPEVVVYDRKGAPFIVNGYKLAGSDYGLRNAYYDANPTKLHRSINSMNEWKNSDNVFWSSEVDPENPYRRKDIEMTDLGKKLRSKGWKIPVRPKKQQSVYSIFCKLIAPFVKKFFTSDYYFAMIRKLNPEKLQPQPVLPINVGPANAELIRKIVSPITIYRYLYMKIVLRNYFFQLVDEKKINTNYAQFEEYLKEHKNQFFDWFCLNFLDSDKGLKEFSATRISDAIIAYNMCTGELNTDGSDVNDGLVFLAGLGNWADATPQMLMNVGNRSIQIRFIDLAVNQDAAGYFLRALQAKDKTAKQAMVRFKSRAQISAKDFFSQKLKKAFFIDENAYQLWKAGSEAGCFTAGSKEAFEHHVRNAAQAGVKAVSPTKPTREVSEDAPVDEPIEGDDDDEGAPQLSPEELAEFGRQIMGA